MPPFLDSDLDSESRPPLNSCCQQMLDALPGLVCQLDREGTICALGTGWDAHVKRFEHHAWESHALLQQPFTQLLPTDEVRQAFRIALGTLAAGAPEAGLLVSDGNPSHPLLLNFTFRTLRDEQAIIGFVAQGLDVTQEHLTRAAVLERERKLREQKARAEQLAADVESLRSQLAAAQTELPSPAATPTPPVPTTLRALAADLAEEYGNLLTGVLGHVSLAASELEDHPAALDDIRAIERAARGAARLTRRLAAVSGTPARRSTVDVAPLLEHLALQMHAAEPVLPESPCAVYAASAVLEVILDAMAEHACDTGAADCGWILAEENEQAVIALCYSGAAAIPAGWQDEPPSHGRLSPLLYAREAALALGGELELARTPEGSRLVLRLPCASAHAMATLS